MTGFSSRSTDRARAEAARRYGWIDDRQLERALAAPLDHSALRALQRDGALDAAQIDALLAASVVIQPEARSSPANAGPAYTVGEVIGGRYRVDAIRHGGFGAVYLGVTVAERPERRVALKTVLSDRADDPEVRACFAEEAARWIALPPHPNLVYAYGVEEHRRQPFIVVERIDGAETWGDLLVRERPVRWQRMLPLLLGAARGLAFALREGNLVHGDIKPANLLSGANGLVKVTDFGLSVPADWIAGATALIAGTPGFIAPEMYHGAPARTASTDVFAFGVTAFAMLTGRMPLPEIVRSPERERAPDVRELAPDAPEELAALIASMLCPAPADRLRDLHAASATLAELHAQLLGCSPPTDPAPDVPGRAASLINVAQSWLALGEVAKAEAAAAQAVQRQPSNWRTHNCHGLALLANRPGNALVSLLRAAELAGDEPVPHGNLAQACRAVGDAANARKHLDRCLLLALSQRRLGECDALSQLIVELLPPNRARKVLDQIVAERPDAVITWNNLAIFHRRLGELERALECTERATTLNPQYAKAWSNRATILGQMKRFAESIAAANRAHEIEPGLTGPHVAKITAYLGLRDVAAAKRELAEALQTHPENPQLRELESRLDPH